MLIRREDEKTEAQGQLLKQQVDEARKQGAQFHSDIEDFGMLDELAHKLELCFQEMSRIRLQEERLDKAALFASSTIMDVPAKVRARLCGSTIARMTHALGCRRSHRISAPGTSRSSIAYHADIRS